MDAVHSSGFSVVEAISLTIFFLLLVASLPLLKRLSIALSDDTLKSFPHVGVEIGDHEQRRRYFLSHSKELYQAGYNQYRKTAFRLTTSDRSQVLVLSPKYLEELRKLPDSILSLEQAVRETMEGKYTGSPGRGSLVITPTTIKSHLNPALVRMNETLSIEVERTIREVIGDCTDWTSRNINKSLLRVVAIVSGRIFIGPELYRKEPYIEAATQYTMELLAAQRAVKAIVPWLRPFLAPFLPELKTLKSRLATADTFLRPVVASRRAQSDVPGLVHHDDFLGWMMADAKKLKIKDDKDIARVQLAISFAAIHTTTMTATNVLYSLAARQEYIEPLRQEIKKALVESNDLWTSHTLSRLPKLDSFIRETMRMDPVFFNAFRRKVVHPFSLSDGTLVPAGTMIEIPYYAITRDPSLFPDPDEFKGFRFVVGEKVPEREQFVAITPSNLLFGYGRHACPGRFFAANELKMIVARILLDYDVRNTMAGTERYRNLEFGTTSIPDPSKELLFKRRI